MAVTLPLTPQTPHPYQYGGASERWFHGVLPELVGVARLALTLSWQHGGPDWSIVDGLRTPAQQAQLFASGASKTLKSAHLPGPSGYGEAIDIRVYLGAGVDPFPRPGNTRDEVRVKLARFEEVARYFFEAADELSFPLQWGNDWDIDGIPTGRDPDEKGQLQDMVHFQRAPQHRIVQAIARANERRHARERGERIIS